MTADGRAWCDLLEKSFTSHWTRIAAFRLLVAWAFGTYVGFDWMVWTVQVAGYAPNDELVGAPAK